MTLHKYIFPIMLALATVASGCKKDPCKDVTCLNGASCTEGDCICTAGFEGTDCGTQMRTKFIGIYNGTFSCPGQNFTVQMNVTTSSTGISNVVFNDGFDTWVGTVSGSSVTINTQTISAGVTIAGSGQLAGNILTLNLNLSGTTCTYSGTKQ